MLEHAVSVRSRTFDGQAKARAHVVKSRTGTDPAAKVGYIPSTTYIIKPNVRSIAAVRRCARLPVKDYAAYSRRSAKSSQASNNINLTSGVVIDN
ncbi:hypothetical protein Bxe_A3716 [Paraburkholderia xenovorans LB400]|uniref:Uncharacterized protein n=1 Tax=Paraburkholderia xenovorans (strain LB400) TaxID=266265 RepID=Q144G6_PARXL|nr:hypothetical protein Bxe_A3716 [Paraburkholderia xenovorans LB400]